VERGATPKRQEGPEISSLPVLTGRAHAHAHVVLTHPTDRCSIRDDLDERSRRFVSASSLIRKRLGCGTRIAMADSRWPTNLSQSASTHPRTQERSSPVRVCACACQHTYAPLAQHTVLAERPPSAWALPCPSRVQAAPGSSPGILQPEAFPEANSRE
jgi:hypothetical protein